MNVFTVSLFGHRQIDDIHKLKFELTSIVRDLIKTKTYVSFLIGRNGEFDIYAASVIKNVQGEIGKENNDMSLVVPYIVADIEYYERYYDSIIFPETVYGAHPKSAITLRNRWMVEHSDLVIVYADHNKGGAYAAIKYAEKLNKGVINLCHRDNF